MGWIEEFLHFGMKDRCWSGLRENQQDPNGEKRYTGLELFIYLSFLRSNPYLFSLRFPFCSMTFSFVFFFLLDFFSTAFHPFLPPPPLYLCHTIVQAVPGSLYEVLRIILSLFLYLSLLSFLNLFWLPTPFFQLIIPSLVPGLSSHSLVCVLSLVLCVSAFCSKFVSLLSDKSDILSSIDYIYLDQVIGRGKKAGRVYVCI